MPALFFERQHVANDRRSSTYKTLLCLRWYNELWWGIFRKVAVTHYYSLSVSFVGNAGGTPNWAAISSFPGIALPDC